MRATTLTAVLGYAVLAAVAITAVIGLSACGSSSSSGSGSLAGDVTAISTGSGGPKGGPITKADIKTASEFVGGKPGKATGTPIRVGELLALSGLVPLKASALAPEAAVKMLNEHLGGVDGHPIQLVPCDTAGTDEKSQACGQKFANDPTIKAVLNPGQVSGGLATLGALQGKKSSFCNFMTPDQRAGTNVFCTTGGVFAASATIPYLQQKVHPKSVAVIVPDDPLFKQLASISLNQLKDAGITPHPGYVPIASPDVTSALVGANVKNVDALFVTLTSSSECIAVAKALKSLGVSPDVPVVTLQTCNVPEVAKALGGEIPKWTYFDVGPSAQVPNPDAQVKVFLDATATYTDSKWGNWPTAAFGNALWLAKVMNQVGADNLTNDKIVAQAKKFTGPMFLGDPEMKFGVAPYVNAGSVRARFFSYEGDGKWIDATDGKWIAPPPE